MKRTAKKKIKATGEKTFHQIEKVKMTVKIVRKMSPETPANLLIILERMGKKAKTLTAKERKPKTCVTVGKREAKAIEPSMAQFKEKGEV